MRDEQVEKAPPRARITGTVYLLYFVTAILAQLLINKRLTATGEVMNFIADGLYIALTLLLYRLFRPVSRSVSLIAALFSLAGCVVTVLEQLHPVGPHLSPLIFFGPFCILLGYLILRSTFLPRLLGVLLMLAGVGWLIYIIPGLPRAALLTIQALGILAEGLFMLWLLAKGVPEERWCSPV